MDYKLAKQIYGQTWCMDEFSLMQYLPMLEAIKQGNHVHSGEKLNSISKQWTEEIISENPDLLNGIAVVNFNGAIILESSMSTKGVKEIASEMLTLNKDPEIKGFLMVANSGGGSSLAVEYMLNVMAQIDKPIIGFIPYGAMACSAMAMILCGCQEIYAEHEMSIVGSFGSMIDLGSSKEKSMTIYATKSTKKNEWIEEAVNGNYEVIRNEFIDPMNERVLSLVESKRPQLKNIEYDNGQSMFAKDAVGSIIDGIASIDEVVSKFNIINNMNLQTLKSDFSDVYNEIVSEERERVLSWMAHLGTDSKVVIDGIKSGSKITESVREELLVKATQKNGLANLASDSPEPVKAKESVEEVEEKEDEVNAAESFYAEVGASFMR